MPEKQSAVRARKNKQRGKAATTQAGAYVEEEMKRVGEKGRRGGRRAKQAIAIGLSRARRAGVKVAPPNPGRASPRTRQRAERDLEAGARTKGERTSDSRGSTAERGRGRSARTAGAREKTKTRRGP